jgi:hypothetical protein
VRRTKRWVWLAAVILLPGAAPPAQAQESRAGAIEQQQSDKAKDVTPETPSKAEEWFVRIKNDLLVAPSGFYPSFDTVYSGGGFTLGAGYHQYYRDRTFWNVVGNLSIKGYKHVGVGTSSLGLLQNRLDLSLQGGWRDMTQIEYFGTGTATTPDAVSNFGLEQVYANALLEGRPTRVLRFHAGAGYESYDDRTGEGTSPSIEQIHLTAPGLGAAPTYIHLQGGAGIDWRTSPGYSRTGGFYGATLHAWSDTDDVYSFEQLDLDAVQHIPILRENWVLSLRARARTVLNDDDVVPYYLLPSLGGGSTLRGYSSWRFRDRHSFMTSGEVRWIPNIDGLDMAIFYDGGEVTSRWSDIDFTGWQHNWGIGARFHGPIATPLRIELARGHEAWQLVFSGSAAF